MLKTEQLYFTSYRLLGLNERLSIFYEVVKCELESVETAAEHLLDMLADKHGCSIDQIKLIRFEEMN